MNLSLRYFYYYSANLKYRLWWVKKKNRFATFSLVNALFREMQFECLCLSVYVCLPLSFCLVRI